MTVGSLVDESDAWIGNLILGGFCVTVMLSTFIAGMMLRKKVRVKIEAEIENLFTTHGELEATIFAKNAGVSLDDARDQLDRRMKERGWHRTELPQYNAIYKRN